MIFLVRHGASRQPPLRPPGDLRPATREEWMLDPPLSGQGRAEAEALGRRLAGTGPWDRLLVSPRTRTRQTAAIALPGAPIIEEPQLHEWHADESMEALHARARWLLSLGEGASVLAFTHGGFIRAVFAAVLCGEDVERFGPLFHDLRRALQVWTGSITPVVHGPGGLEVLASNACAPVEAFTGRS